MKNIKFKKWALYLALVFVFTACSKDFLDVEPVGKLSEGDFYQTDEDASQALVATYDILQMDMPWGSWASSLLVKTLPSDESTAGGASEADQAQYQRLDKFSYSSGNDGIKNVFIENYFGVYRANKVINKVSPDNAIRKQYIAEAKVLRAYFYFELVRMYGGVPLRLEEPAPSEYPQARATAAEIYTQIIKDLNEALPDLKHKSELTGSDAFRVSIETAYAMLGRAYLYQKDWTNAASNFDKLIQEEGSEVALDPDFHHLFTADGEFGKESLLEASFTSDEHYNWGTFPWGRTNESNIHVQLTGPRSDYFNAGTTGMIGGWGFNYPTKTLYDAYTAEDTVRKAATTISLADLQAKGGAWNDGGNTVWGFEGYFRVKYGTLEAETTTQDGSTAELNYGTNWRLLRYADILLMAAEAYHMDGNDTKALTELNKVRARAGVSASTATGTALMTAIKHEREVELAFEGVRFFDLVRWGDAPTVLGPLGFVQGKNELFPIPLDEMNSNPLSVQNPGY